MRIIINNEHKMFILKHCKATGLTASSVVKKALSFYKVMAPEIEKKVEETGKIPK